jgi:hypothetical protein
VIEQLERKEIEVIEGTVEAPLWGRPPLGHEKEHGSKLGEAFAKEKEGAYEDTSKDT